MAVVTTGVQGDCGCCGGGCAACLTCSYLLVLWFPGGVNRAPKDYILHAFGSDIPFTDLSCDDIGSPGVGSNHGIHVFGNCSTQCYDKVIDDVYNSGTGFVCPTQGCYDTDAFDDVECLSDAPPVTVEYVGFTGGSGGFSDAFFYWWQKICDDDTDDTKCCLGNEQYWPGTGGPGYETDELSNISTYGLESDPCCEEMPMAVMATMEKKKRVKSPDPACMDRSRELLTGEIAAAGLDTRRKWYACTTGEHPAHCGCKGNRKTV